MRFILSLYLFYLYIYEEIFWKTFFISDLLYSLFFPWISLASLLKHFCQYLCSRSPSIQIFFYLCWFFWFFDFFWLRIFFDYLSFSHACFPGIRHRSQIFQLLFTRMLFFIRSFSEQKMRQVGMLQDAAWKARVCRENFLNRQSYPRDWAPANIKSSRCLFWN